jgi:hypothetical protein
MSNGETVAADDVERLTYRLDQAVINGVSQGTRAEPLDLHDRPDEQSSDVSAPIAIIRG